MSWNTPEMPLWTRNHVEKDDYLRILLRFEKRRLGVCFRLNSFLPSRYVYFNYLPGHPMERLYLALESSEMFDKKGILSVAIPNPFEMFTWSVQRKQGIVKEEQKTTKCIEIETTSSESDEAKPPICTFCWDRPIGTILMPCNHAVCCNVCKDNYISHERKRNKMINGSTDVVCPVCREKIERVAQIWFPKICRCLLCEDDCKTMSAVAGGENGCGCVIGCYEKAKKLCDNGSLCPHCHTELVDILQIFVQGVQDH
uniref:RING-type domain-containing protein n=1 Tax=Setaria digitata TaxID=48799 RepID=A0A915PP95_9BILA